MMPIAKKKGEEEVKK
jgi:serine/threonine protein kinase